MARITTICVIRTAAAGLVPLLLCVQGEAGQLVFSARINADEPLIEV
ncbi:hypothetical protein H9L17_13795 [Thermomonas brevis]|uniref:Uncharacterized protein n=1 Tax=Thermomonas brevis TaxID=215691 RepID=A0A7G9QSA5_9GAMM|nr:hypothetical protein [Thermomonas brevis]QNN46230.1 hypothetical protein H9L17_13795 [Thermomonas brevis]